ncbi:MAG: calcium-binding protein, partial [Gammaproteobacteria bacterium]|nr:calcium-binding protein [Gammaproteobacteria bacterium]
DDGLLVLDRNGNGNIDSGRELFGDNTQLPDGSLATDGYAALAQLDSNSDGKIDINDARFADLNIWRDLNQDGISQTNELFTLNELGVASISTQYEQTNRAQNGNEIRFEGEYTRQDGTTDATGDVFFNTSNFFTEFTNPIDIPVTHQGLPNMHGSGAVRNLREAATISGPLATLLENYSKAATRAEQMAMLDALLMTWSSTSGMQSMVDRAEEENFVVIYEFGDKIPTPSLDALKAISTQSGGSNNGSGSVAGNSFWQQAMESQDLVAYQKWFRIISILERFNGEEFIEFVQPEPDTSNYLAINSNTSGGSGGGRVVSNAIYTKVTIRQQQLDLLEQSYNALRDSVYHGLLLQTRLSSYMNEVGLIISDTGELEMDFSQMESLIETRKGVDQLNTTIDVLDLIQNQGGNLRDSGWKNGATLLVSMIHELNESDYQTIASLSNELNDTFIGGTNQDSFSGTGGDDVMLGGGDDDTLTGGSGNDTLNGGTGNDTMNGGYGSDTYIFNLGDGQDR